MTRIPMTIAEFDVYLGITDDRLQAINPGSGNKYGLDYGLIAAELADYTGRRVNWRDVLYPRYINPATSTSIVKQDVKDFMTDFRAFAEPLLNKIAASNIAGNEEEEIFNIDLERDIPTRARLIDIAPGFSFEPSTHGVHHFRFSNPLDPATQAMPEKQKVYIERFVGPAGLDPATIPFGNAQVIGRFLHHIDYPEGDTGKTAYYRVAYINTRGEKGPESAIFSQVIM